MRSPESVFTQIYLKNEWGGEPGEFCSGGGSTDHEIASRYIRMLGSNDAGFSLNESHLVDLGCGDMRIGNELIPLCRSFTGVDVVKPLIEHHQSSLGSSRVRFEHLNIIDDKLPDGDICLIRQVLQHLSNHQIAQILHKLKKYRHIIITEHVPSSQSNWTPNLDKPTGKGIRLERNSGVDITSPPFSIPSKSVRTILDVPGNPHDGGGDPGIIRTVIYTPDPSHRNELD